jgi:hypothetical protein
VRRQRSPGAPVTVAVSAPGGAAVTKQAAPASAVPGDYLTYTLTITNAPARLGRRRVSSSANPAGEVTYQSMGFGVTGYGDDAGRWQPSYDGWSTLLLSAVSFMVQAIGRVASPWPEGRC